MKCLDAFDLLHIWEREQKALEGWERQKESEKLDRKRSESGCGKSAAAATRAFVSRLRSRRRRNSGGVDDDEAGLLEELDDDTEELFSTPQNMPRWSILDSLSVGEKQRLGFARALFWKPRLLIVDEGTSALDERTERQVWNKILSLQHQESVGGVGVGASRTFVTCPITVVAVSHKTLEGFRNTINLS
jgi:ABC-type glutathione transport system ATPase component